MERRKFLLVGLAALAACSGSSTGPFTDAMDHDAVYLRVIRLSNAPDWPNGLSAFHDGVSPEPVFA